MSGIDEQISDIPDCPNCGERPNFWVLYPDAERTGLNGWYWLHSDKFLGGEHHFSKLSVKGGLGGIRPTLNDIVRVVCSAGNAAHHVFTSEHLVFQEVLQLARRLER